MATETKLKLDAPDAVKVIAPEAAAGLVPLSEGQKSELETRVEGFIATLVAQDANSPEFGKQVDRLSNLGQQQIAEAAGQSNRFLDRPVRAMDKDNGIGADLTQLRRTVEDLDPSKRGDFMTRKKFFGIIPMGNKARNYFDSYKSAQGHISTVLKSLANGKDELLRDNAAIDTERKQLWESMGKLEQMIHMSKLLDHKLEGAATELEAGDPAKAKAIRETALFYTRQRSTDLLTQMAVSVQGYLALDLVKKNNIELLKGVDRASTTTVSALRTAVTVAQALTGQKLVLDQITALNTTTANVIDATGTMLRVQTAEIHKQAASSTIPVETLKQAFQNIYQTMDSIDQFKMQALESMKTTVTTLSSEVEKSKSYIARAEGTAMIEGKGASAEPLTPIAG